MTEIEARCALPKAKHPDRDASGVSVLRRNLFGAFRMIKGEPVGPPSWQEIRLGQKLIATPSDKALSSLVATPPDAPVSNRHLSSAST